MDEIQNESSIEHQDSLKILVLDDEESFTSDMQIYLQKAGFETFISNTVDPAIEVLKNYEIDLLIMCVRLTGANGLDILKQVKEEYPRVEVIIASGHGDIYTAIKSFRLGALDYLRKPFSQSELQIALDRAMKIINQKRELTDRKPS